MEIRPPGDRNPRLGLPGPEREVALETARTRPSGPRSVRCDDGSRAARGAIFIVPSGGVAGRGGGRRAPTVGSGPTAGGQRESRDARGGRRPSRQTTRTLAAGDGRFAGERAIS